MSTRFVWHARTRSVLVAVVSAALVVTVGEAAQATPEQAPAAPAKTAAKAQRVASRPDAVSAQLTARAQGSRVEIEGMRDATSTTWANPDGTLTTQAHQGPIRTRDAHGGWVDVDLSLAKAADGTVAPRNHPFGLRLAGGKGADGTAPTASGTALAQLDEAPDAKRAPRQVVLGWPGKLGAPVLSGSTATYTDAQPGLDVVVEARRTGYEQHVVIRDAAALGRLRAAAGQGPVSWKLPVRTKGLTAQAEEDGSVSFVDAQGQVASRFAAPTAWDAATDEHSGNHVNTSPVAVSVAQDGKGKAVLTLTPDQRWLADPERAFPITIDPSYATGSVTANLDTYVSSAYPTATYASATELRVGTYNGGSDKYRSYLQFPLSGFGGKDIVTANLSLYEFHSWSCTAKPFSSYGTSGQPSASTNWNNKPGQGTKYGTATVAKGFSSSCAAGRVSVSVLGAAQYWSSHASGYGAIQISASETDNYGWKKFSSLETSNDPYISYTYNRKPNAAAAPTLGSPATPYNGAIYTSDSTPTFSSTATDPDGSGYSITTEVHSSTAGTDASYVTYCKSPRTTGQYTPSGQPASCTLTTALADNKTYYARTAVVDDRGLWNGTWSAWTSFKTALAGPPTPTISCPSPYSNGAWIDTLPTSGIACTVTATGSGTTAPVSVTTSLDGAAGVKTTITSLPKTVTVTVPKTAGLHTVKAFTTSAAAKSSATAGYSFGLGSAKLSAPTVTPRVATTGTVKIAANGPPKGSGGVPTASVKWRLASSGDDELTGWNTATSAPVTVTDNGASGVAVSGTWNTMAETTDAFLDADPDTAGVQPTTLNPRVPTLLDVQVCLAYTAGTQCTWSETRTTVMRLPHAFGDGFPTSDAGPGQVALFTGEFNASETDVSVPGYTGDLSVSRSHSTYGNDPAAATDPVTGVFGPGWTANLEGSEAGQGGLQVIDSTRADGSLVFLDDDGSALVYLPASGARRTGATLTAGVWIPADEDTDQAAIMLKVAGTGASTTLTLTEDDGTATVFTPATAALAPAAKSAGTFAPAKVTEPGGQDTTYTRDTAGRVTRILAPVPPGTVAATGRAVACPDGPISGLDKGCRALRIGYGNGTAVGGVTPVLAKQVTAELYNPSSVTVTACDDTTSTASAGMVSVPVACYSYDATNHLTGVKDPRSGLTTSYTYGSHNELTGVTSTGQDKTTLVYETLDGRLKLTAVTRPRPAPLSGTANLLRVVYGVPVSGAGLPDLSGTAVAAWAQTAAPTYAAATFGPDYPGSIDPSTGPDASGDWAYADLSYTDPAGYTINTAAYGAGAWQRDATAYDAKGNIVSYLDEAAIAKVTDPDADISPDQASGYATLTVYNATDVTKTVDGDPTVVTPAGTRVTDTYGPLHDVVLPDGTTTPARAHTHTDYDEDAPHDGVNPATNRSYDLPTTATTSAADATGEDIAGSVVTTTTSVYDAQVTGTGDGWTLGAATKTTTGGIATVTVIDDLGRTTQTRQPLSSGTDAGTTLTRYYTADASSGDTACNNTPEWAGLTCRTLPAAPPSTGPAMPDTRTSGYSLWLAPTTVVETSGTATRTSNTRYDPAGRTTASWTTATITGSVSRPGSYTHYNTAGLVDYTGALNTTHDDAQTTGRTTTGYDTWGRPVTTTTDDGTTTTTYDTAGRVASVADPKGTTSYTYDSASERRGKVTALAVTRGAGAGTLTYGASYDAAGNLTRQTLPGALAQITTYDVTGQETGLAYTGQVTPVTEDTDPDTGETTYTPGTPVQDQPWISWTLGRDIADRVATQANGAGAATDGTPGVTDLTDVTAPAVGHAATMENTYTYDAAARLTGVTDHHTPYAADTGASVCQDRTYTFDNNSRRTQLVQVTHPDGDCATTTGATTTTTSYSYDTADRPTTGADGTGTYDYDTFGRQTTIPAVDTPAYTATTVPAGTHDLTIGYYDDDQAATLTQDGTTTTITLDAAGRRATLANTGTSTDTQTNHYTDDSDNPTWTDTTTGAGTATTRYAESIDGDLGATLTADGSATIPLTNEHGDTLTTVAIPAAQSTDTPAVACTGWADYTEYGTPLDGAAATAVAGDRGYGWLGAKQRSTTPTFSAGLTLMGARLYNATRGLFTTTDPTPGGSATTYAYPTDPINQADVRGQRWHPWRWAIRGVFRPKNEHLTWRNRRPALHWIITDSESSILGAERTMDGTTTMIGSISTLGTVGDVAPQDLDGELLRD